MSYNPANEGSNFSVFENLAIIPELMEEIKAMRLEIKELKKTNIRPIDLTKSSGVKKYLEISQSTLNRMIEDGRLKDGIHYTKEIIKNRVNITYVENAIITYKG